MADPTVTSLFNVPFDQASLPKVNVPDVSQPRKNGKHSGVAGVARDVFGFLGDFLLTRLGMPAMYAPAQRQRKLNEALEGFDQDPLAAIQRVEDVDAPTAIKLRESLTDNQRQAAALAGVQEAREARLEAARLERENKARLVTGNMLDSMSDWDEAKRERDYPLLREQAVANAKRMGLDISSELPDKFDALTVDAYIDRGIPAGVQRAQRLTKERNELMAAQGERRLDQGDERTVIARQNANTSEYRAKKPQASRKVQEYVGDDNFKYTKMSDGSVIKSDKPVRQSGKPTRAAPTLSGVRTLPSGVKVKIRN